MTKFPLLKIITASLLLINSATYASDNDRPDDHAPIGVSRDHIHKKGESMLSYKYSFMKMKGARDGSNRVSSAQVLNKYKVAPSSMDMKMHMLGAMYGVTDNLTLAAMGSVIKKDMKMTKRSGEIINRDVSGFGDSKINAMYSVLNKKDKKLQFNLGVSIPTGSIKENHNETRLSYPMQLGSGSYELLPGLSYSGFQESCSYGAQINSTLRLNNNNNGYKLGDSYNATAWAAKKLNESFSISSRLNYTITKKISGSDDALVTSMAMTPMNETSFYAGRSLDFLLGTNFIVAKGALKGHRLAIEGGVPIYQSFNGVRLETDYKITLGWQKAF